jgi:hypothetical protein
MLFVWLVIGIRLEKSGGVVGRGERRRGSLGVGLWERWLSVLFKLFFSSPRVMHPVSSILEVGTTLNRRR